MGERTVHDRRWWILGALILSLPGRRVLTLPAADLPEPVGAAR